MTLEEKVGQMVQYPAGHALVGPDLHQKLDYNAMIAAGEIGGMNVADAHQANAYQRLAVEKSRLHIPLIVGLDVIHGYHTIYPIPLGLAASFDPELVREASRLAAREASADGIRMTNSPMVDVARDARWGRTAEGAGESEFLGAVLARAYVRGYQGDNLAAPDSVAACVKHFAAYGAPVAGRDYNAVDLSEVTLRQVYLPPYRAAVDAGAAVMMSAFNSLNGVPATADRYTLTTILRGEWGFRGFVRADYNAVAELIAHGTARDGKDAARQAAVAGLDMDMASSLFHAYLAGLVRTGAVPQAAVDDAVRRILRVKFALGLFEHPYVDEAAAADHATPEKRALARKAAIESMVLLRNQPGPEGRPVLPFGDAVRTVAVLGPFADAATQMLGTWHGKGRAQDVVTLRSALEARMKARGGKAAFAEGTRVLRAGTGGFAEAEAAVRASDVVVIALGEDARTMTGEATSRAQLDLPGNQEALLERVAALGKPVVLVVFSGRPLVLNWAATHVAAIVAAWFPGEEAGDALCDLLFGQAGFSGKLPVTFPRAVGQVPLYLEQLPTGRPATEDDPAQRPASGPGKFVSAYVDVRNSPLYPFGYGLAYTSFAYGAPVATQDRQTVEVTTEVRNAGPVAGTAVAQLYLRIRGASVEQPVRRLVGFERVALAPGEARTVRFHLGFNELSIVDAAGHREVEATEDTFYVGGDSSARGSVTVQIKP